MGLERRAFLVGAVGAAVVPKEFGRHVAVEAASKKLIDSNFTVVPLDRAQPNLTFASLHSTSVEPLKSDKLGEVVGSTGKPFAVTEVGDFKTVTGINEVSNLWTPVRNDVLINAYDHMMFELPKGAQEVRVGHDNIGPVHVSTVKLESGNSYLYISRTGDGHLPKDEKNDPASKVYVSVR